ncbi:MAG: hypothetical protein AB2806_20635, partial [Candidatus Thiodiazotropha sp.]
ELPTDINGGQFLFERITGLDEVTREQLIQHAKNSIAWRYALRELNPFVVEDAEYQDWHGAGHDVLSGDHGWADEKHGMDGLWDDERNNKLYGMKGNFAFHPGMANSNRLAAGILI